MEIIAEGEDFKTYVIGTVRKNSPADEVGLQKGDTIIAVDDNMATMLTMSEVYKIINKKGGRRTAVFVKRDDLFFIVEIVLREPI
jgi:C-terminal processing protease CtpA/Prc